MNLSRQIFKALTGRDLKPFPDEKKEKKIAAEIAEIEAESFFEIDLQKHAGADK